MQVQTHILVGWCFGNFPQLTAKQRFCCMAAALVADFDGLGIIFGSEYYHRYHHVLGHGFIVAALIALLLARWDHSGWRIFLLYYLLYCSHLLLDSFGSGIGWGQALFWPLSEQKFVNRYAWDFQSWQNMVALVVVAFWTWQIAVVKRRTPFEYLMPKLERKIVERLEQFSKR